MKQKENQQISPVIKRTERMISCYLKKNLDTSVHVTPYILMGVRDRFFEPHLKII